VSGGAVLSTYDGTQYVFSADTFGETVTWKHNARLDTSFPASFPYIGIGHAFDNKAVNASGYEVSPAKHYTLTITYTAAEVSSAIESSLRLYSWDGNQWLLEPSAVLDMTANTISATPNHGGVFAVFGEVIQLLLPVVRK
jgi:hypothetical protein